MRCLHESQLYEQNTFITLTYNPENRPSNGSLDVADWQKFMKRFRKKISPLKIRFFMGAEYGDQPDPLTSSTLGHPHYHAIIFNYDFPDKVHKTTRNEHKLYESEILNKLWGKGFCTIGDVSFQSAAYVARYCMKKRNGVGDIATDHYSRIDPATGEWSLLHPEFMTCSQGIGKGWFEKYKSDLEKGFVTINGVKHTPPKYYERLLEEVDDCLLAEIKQDQIENINPEHSTIPRLRIREKVRIKRTQSLTREL